MYLQGMGVLQEGAKEKKEHSTNKHNKNILNRERNPVLFQGGNNNENSTQYFSIKLL